MCTLVNMDGCLGLDPARSGLKNLIVAVQSFSRVRLFVIPWTAARQASVLCQLLPELAQTHVHQDSDVIQPYHPLSPPCPPAFNRFQHQGLFLFL